MVYDVAVIGAGITGAMAARELSRYNLKICILEKEADVSEGASKANSAIVHAGFDAECGTMKAKLNVLGAEIMKTAAQELGVKYKNNGSLVIGFNNEDRQTIKCLCERGIKNGVQHIKIIEKYELRELEPNISEEAVCALYAPSGAIVCPYELTIAAVGNAMDNGAELITEFEVGQIEYDNEVYKISSRNKTVYAANIVNAAGVYADKIASMAGDNSYTIYPRRGEYILLDKECGNFVAHTVFQTPGKMGKGILVSPTVDGNLLIGPTSEDIYDKDNTATTAEGLKKITAESIKSVKGIPFGKTITSFCGLRAVGSTGDFIINSPQKGFVNAAGIESPGLSASPAIALEIVSLLKKSGVKLRKNDNFNPCRKSYHWFKNAPRDEKNKIIESDKTFGKIVCRCENVTEGEILYAMRQNPKPSDMDGIKRRTRAQMGRCQGGFCMPNIIEIMSRELGVRYEDITKKGGKSVISIEKTKGEKKYD